MRFLISMAAALTLLLASLAPMFVDTAHAQDGYAVVLPSADDDDFIPATDAEILAAIVANREAAAAAFAAAGDAGAADGDEVLGVTQDRDGDLAFPGGNVSVPAAVGAGLVALGSISVLAARKRERQGE